MFFAALLNMLIGKKKTGCTNSRIKLLIRGSRLRLRLTSAVGQQCTSTCFVGSYFPLLTFSWPTCSRTDSHQLNILTRYRYRLALCSLKTQVLLVSLLLDRITKQVELQSVSTLLQDEMTDTLIEDGFPLHF